VEEILTYKASRKDRTSWYSIYELLQKDFNVSLKGIWRYDCGSKIIAFPKRAPFTLKPMRLILIYSIPKLPDGTLERVLRAK
jgi:hypothetical protein